MWGDGVVRGLSTVRVCLPVSGERKGNEKTHLRPYMSKINPQLLQQRRLALIPLRAKRRQPTRPQTPLFSHPPTHSLHSSSTPTNTNTSHPKSRTRPSPYTAIPGIRARGVRLGRNQHHRNPPYEACEGVVLAGGRGRGRSSRGRIGGFGQNRAWGFGADMRTVEGSIGPFVAWVV